MRPLGELPLCQPPLEQVRASHFTVDELRWFFAYLKAFEPRGFERALQAISEDRASGVFLPP